MNRAGHRAAEPAAPVWGIGSDLAGRLAITAVLAVGGLSVVVLAGAQLAAVAFGAGPMPAGLADAGAALFALHARPADPAAAWPAPAAAVLPCPVAYWTCTAGVALAAAALAGAGLWWHRTRWQHRTNALGVARPGGLATRRDLRHLTVGAPQPGRITLGVLGRRLLATQAQASLAVVGPTGCGKTAGFAIPALLEWQGPVIATSVKGDLLEATAAHRRRHGPVWVFDPTGITGHPAHPWSPLTGCRTWGGAQRVASWLCEAAQPKRDTVTDGDYWYTQARKGLAPYLHAAALDNRTMADVVRWVDTQAVDDVEAILCHHGGVDDQLRALALSPEAHALRRRLTAGIEARELAVMRAEFDPDLHPWILEPPTSWPIERQRQLKEHVGQRVHGDVDAELLGRAVDQLAPTGRLDALLAARALWAKEARLRSSIFATIENVLAGYADPAVAASTATDGIDLGAWLDGNSTIYIVATAHEQARLRPVLTVLLQQAIRFAYDQATARGGTLARPCLVLLDEAGNIAPLRDLPGYAATARSHGISLVSIWQDLAQLKALYGDRAQTVLNNHAAKLFGTGIADDATLDYISRLIGDERRTETNRSGDLHSGRASISEHVTYRRTAPADTVRRVPPDHALLFYGRDLPAQIRLRPWYQQVRRRR